MHTPLAITVLIAFVSAAFTSNVGMAESPQSTSKRLLADEIEQTFENLNRTADPKAVYELIKELTLDSYVLFLGSKSEAERQGLSQTRKTRLQAIYRAVSELSLLDENFDQLGDPENCARVRDRLKAPWTTQTEIGVVEQGLPAVDRVLFDKMDLICQFKRDQ